MPLPEPSGFREGRCRRRDQLARGHLGGLVFSSAAVVTPAIGCSQSACRGLPIEGRQVVAGLLQHGHDIVKRARCEPSESNVVTQLNAFSSKCVVFDTGDPHYAGNRIACETSCVPGHLAAYSIWRGAPKTAAAAAAIEHATYHPAAHFGTEMGALCFTGCRSALQPAPQNASSESR